MSQEKDIGSITIITSPDNTIRWEIENFFFKSEISMFEFRSPTFEMWGERWHLMMEESKDFPWESTIRIGLVNEKFKNIMLYNCVYGILMKDGTVRKNSEMINKCAVFFMTELKHIDFLKDEYARFSNGTLVLSLQISPTELDSPTFEESFKLESTRRTKPLKGRPVNMSEGEALRSDDSIASTFGESSSTQEGTDSNLGGDHILLRKLREIYNNSIYCDVTLRLGQREFIAHKSILSVSSPVFASMFQHNMKEKNTGVVEIDDCDPETFQEFLEYLYTADTMKFSMERERILNLYIIADKYDVKQLMKVCVQFMMKNLSIEVFCDVLKLALKYKELHLIKSAEEFFVKNAKSIITTVKWQSFINENGTIANELFVKVLK